MQFVLDCSVAISWCLVDEDNDYANAILAMMPDCEAFVPNIWSLEVANTFLVAEGRNRMTIEQSEIAIALLQSLLIQVDDATDSNALSSTLVLGRQEGLAAYDAAYLELAVRYRYESSKIFSNFCLFKFGNSNEYSTSSGGYARDSQGTTEPSCLIVALANPHKHDGGISPFKSLKNTLLYQL